MMDIKGPRGIRFEPVAGLPRAPEAFRCALLQPPSTPAKTAGMLDGILDRLATYKEKILGIKSKIKSALFLSDFQVVVVAIAVHPGVIMIWVIPAFKQVLFELRRQPARAGR